MFVYYSRSRIIDRSHYLICHFDDRNTYIIMPKILRHFQPDKSATDNNRLFHVSSLEKFLNVIGIIDITQSEYTLRIDSWKRRTYGYCSRRQKQLIVRFGILFSFTVTHQYSLLTEIYRNDLRFCPDIQIKPFPEYFRGLHK